MTITDEGIRIDVPFIELPNNEKRVRPVCKEAYLLLHKYHLIYKIIANYESADNTEGVLKPYKCNNRGTYLKSDLCLVEKFKDNVHDTWAVGIKFRGAGGLEWDFRDSVDAIKLYDTLQEYFITRP